MIRVEFQLTPKDYCEYSLRHELLCMKSGIYNLCVKTIMWLLYLAVLTVCMLFLYYFVRAAIHDYNVVLNPAVVLPLFLGGIVVVPPIREYRRIKKLIKKIGVTTIQFDNTGLLLQDRLTTTKVLWPIFIHFEETRHLYILYYTGKNAILIPKRAFSTEEESHHFRGLAQSGITKAQGFPVQPKSP